MNLSFWAGGPDSLRKGLQEERDAKLRELQAKLAECETADQHDQLESEIKQAKADYAAKCKDGDSSIF